MNSVKCVRCGLQNFLTDERCKRCATPLSASASPNANAFESKNASEFQETNQESNSETTPFTRIQGYSVIVLLAVILSLIVWNSLKQEAVTPKFEYRVVEFMTESNERTGTGALKYSSIRVDEGQLQKLGEDGWELVNSFVENETAFPNFGDSQYVTGIQPNIRPQRAIFIFKKRTN